MSLWGHGGSYSDWADFLDRWAIADRPLPDRPPALAVDDFDGPTWTRLMLRIQDAVNTRLGRWSDSLVRQLNEAADEFSWGRALTNARVGLRTMLELASMPELTPDIRDHLRKQIEGVIASTQQTLEDSAHRDLRGPGGREADMRLRQLRTIPLHSALRGPVEVTTQSPQFPIHDPPAGGGRRRAIIIDRELNQ